MKLYATVASERATKGQGGSGVLTITLYGENRKPLGDILFSSCHHAPPCHSGHGLAQVRVFNNLLAVEVVDYPDTKLPPYLQTKGEKEKGERCYHENVSKRNGKEICDGCGLTLSASIG